VSHYDTLTLSPPEAGVAVVTLDRPARRNAMTVEMFDEFVALQREVDADPDIRSLVLTGAGAGFCAGLDLDLAESLADIPAAEAGLSSALTADVRIASAEAQVLATRTADMAEALAVFRQRRPAAFVGH
jgi:enoyl-CoA hydratase/carnithine racemase